MRDLIPSRQRTVRLIAAALCVVAFAGCGSVKGGGPGSGGIAGMEAAGASGIAGVGGHAGGAGASAGLTGQAGTANGADAGASGSDWGGGGQGPFPTLDMNDVTILAPLPATATAMPVLLRGTDPADDETALVPRELFDRLVVDDGFGKAVLRPEAYDDLELVAVRFDLCDRQLPGVCPEAEDARLRLVFQPILRSPTFDTADAEDAGFHAFYAIHNAEIADAVASLRELADSAAEQSGALRVSPALSAPDPEAYASKLRAFVRRYGGETRLVRLTMNAQPETSAQVRWVLRGVVKQADAFVDIAMVGTQETLESVILASDGKGDYDVSPTTGIPPGLVSVLTSSMFQAADATTRRQYLAELAAVDNPLIHTAETVACVACHVSTFVMHARSTVASIEPETLPERYTSEYELSTEGGKSAETARSIRALGYRARDTMISQRVVNDTAQTLTELEQRYPAR